MDWEYSGKLFRGASAEKLLGLAGEIPREFWEGMDIKGDEVPPETPHSKTHAEEGVSGEHFRVLFWGLLTGILYYSLKDRDLGIS